MKGKTIAESNTIMTELIMPNDANPLGNLMGGNLMRWMDIAGGICAARHSDSHVVTVIQTTDQGRGSHYIKCQSDPGLQYFHGGFHRGFCNKFSREYTQEK